MRSTGILQTTGPIVVRGKLLNRSHCNPSSPLPGECFITAHHAQFGEPLWRVNVIARPGEPGGETWGGLPLEARRHAAAWMPGSYDPELNLVYWGTGVTAPVPEKLRGAGKADLLGHIHLTVWTDLGLPHASAICWIPSKSACDWMDVGSVWQRENTPRVPSPFPSHVGHVVVFRRIIPRTLPDSPHAPRAGRPPRPL